MKSLLAALVALHLLAATAGGVDLAAPDAAAAGDGGAAAGDATAAAAAASSAAVLAANATAAAQALAAASPLDVVLSRYFTNEELEAHLKDFAARCSKIARLTSIGASAEGRTLWALELTDRPGEVEEEPNVRYVGGVHGDEPTGRQLLLALAEHLCEAYGRDAAATTLVRRTHLWLLPAMNPDGFAARRRENAAGVDLNRDFPDRFSLPPGCGAGGALGARAWDPAPAAAPCLLPPRGGEQPETRAAMAWARVVPFAASAALHEGALVANYPWDAASAAGAAPAAAPSPDDATFRHLASAYARLHATMSAGSPEFAGGDGTTNGGAWYPVRGSMQDWMYAAAGCAELTLELSPRKWPPAAELRGLWAANAAALVRWPVAAALGGVRGRVMESLRPPRARGKAVAIQPAKAYVRVLGGPAGDGLVSRATWTFGDFYRPLAPGAYELEVTALHLDPQRVRVVVPPDGSGARVKVLLWPDAARQLTMKGGARRAAVAAVGAGGGAGAGGNAVLVVAMVAALLGLWAVHALAVARARRAEGPRRSA